MANRIIINNGYIVATATTPFGTDANADEIEQMLQHQPQAGEGYIYQLRADTLEWVLVELPPMPEDDEEATAEDYEEVLADLGVIGND